MVLIISFGCMMSAIGKATEGLVRNLLGSAFGIVLAMGALEFLPEMADWSLGQAELLTGAAGVDSISTPYEVAQHGLEMFGLAADHAAAQVGPGVRQHHERLHAR